MTTLNILVSWKCSSDPDWLLCMFRESLYFSFLDLVVSLLTPLFMEHAAAATSLQSCPTLCNPIDGRPPGSPVPGILQARTLEWVAISFSNAWKWKVKVKSLSRVQLLVTPWTAAHQAPPSMGFSRQECWSGVPSPSPPMCNLLRRDTQEVNCLTCVFLLLLFSHEVVPDSSWPHGLQHASLLSPPLSPGVCSNSCPLSWGCYITISFSVAPFSFCLQSFQTSESFPVSWLFTSDGQSIESSALASVLLLFRVYFI